MLRTIILLSLSLGSLACTTTGRFKLPSNTQLQLNDRKVTLDANGEWTGTPFFWDAKDGASYRLLSTEGGKVVRSGKLKTEFRIVSILWPPAAVVYWPMGLQKDTYDLTVPGDGGLVRDDAPPAKPLPPAVTPPAAPAPKKRTTTANR